MASAGLGRDRRVHRGTPDLPCRAQRAAHRTVSQRVGRGSADRARARRGQDRRVAARRRARANARTEAHRRSVARHPHRASRHSRARVPLRGDRHRRHRLGARAGRRVRPRGWAARLWRRVLRSAAPDAPGARGARRRRVLGAGRRCRAARAARHHDGHGRDRGRRRARPPPRRTAVAARPCWGRRAPRAPWGCPLAAPRSPRPPRRRARSTSRGDRARRPGLASTAREPAREVRSAARLAETPV